VTSDESAGLSTKGEAVLSTSPRDESVRLADINLLRNSMMTQSATAPEKMRTNVNVAASILVCFSAARQSRELLANAIIASSVKMKSRVGFKAK
jgi:hypothetical protein